MRKGALPQTSSVEAVPHPPSATIRISINWARPSSAEGAESAHSRIRERLDFFTLQCMLAGLKSAG